MSTATTGSRGSQPDQDPLSTLGQWPPEGTVLAHVLEQHPRRLTLRELESEVEGCLQDAALRRAVDNLTAAQLLRQQGADLVPDPAVVDFDQDSTTEA